VFVCGCGSFCYLWQHIVLVVTKTTSTSPLETASCQSTVARAPYFSARERAFQIEVAANRYDGIRESFGALIADYTQPMIAAPIGDPNFSPGQQVQFAAAYISRSRPVRR
jgi:hypothetical protein